MATATTTASTKASAKATKAKAAKAAKAPEQVAPAANEAPDILRESSKQSPCEIVWAYAHKHHEKLGRAEIVRQLEKMGIAYNTAATQFQRAHAAGYPADRATWLGRFNFNDKGQAVKRKPAPPAKAKSKAKA
jgi:hypothetical protein